MAVLIALIVLEGWAVPTVTAAIKGLIG